MHTDSTIIIIFQSSLQLMILLDRTGASIWHQNEELLFQLRLDTPSVKSQVFFSSCFKEFWPHHLPTTFTQEIVSAAAVDLILFGGNLVLVQPALSSWQDKSAFVPLEEPDRNKKYAPCRLMLIKTKDPHAVSQNRLISIPLSAIYSVCFLKRTTFRKQDGDMLVMGRAGRPLEVSLGPAEDQGFLTKEPLLSFLPPTVSLHQAVSVGMSKFVFASNLKCVCVCRCVCPKGFCPGGLTP